MLKAPVFPELRDGLLASDLSDPRLEIPSSDSTAMHDLVQYVMNVLEKGLDKTLPVNWSTLAELLLDEHIRAMFEITLKVSDEFGSSASNRTVLSAIEFLRDNFHRPLRLSDIAAAVGVSSRRLQTSFRSVTGETPWSSLTSIRLSNARLRLLNPRQDETVTQIAVGCGFSHLGRFSQKYKEKFGEFPSQSLGKSIRTSARKSE